MPSKHDGTDAGSTGFVTIGLALLANLNLRSGRDRISMGSHWWNVLESIERLACYSQLSALKRMACLNGSAQ